jgi:hypothetical protein
MNPRAASPTPTPTPTPTLTLTLSLALILSLVAAPAVAQTPNQAPAGVQAQSAPPAPAAANQVFVEQQSAPETRARLHELLRQHPPAVGEILRRDPSLARQDYLAPYPSLLAFIQQHPEITRNPAFFFGEYEFQEERPQDRSMQMFDRLMDGFGFLFIFGGLVGVLIWLVRSIIDQRRWLRVSRTQAEVHTKLLDRLTSNEDLMTYIQTPAGRRFLESGPLLTGAESAPQAGAPLSRIILSLQAGVVLASLGVGFWIAETRFPEEMGEGFFIIGTLAAALGIGFVVSAAAAYVISSRFGLVAPRPMETHE